MWETVKRKVPMRKFLKIPALALAVLLLCGAAFGCGGKEDAEEYMAGFSVDGSVSGGVRQEGVNARALHFEQEGEDLRITLEFVSGSRLSGGTEERALSEPPAYQVSMLPSPARLAVSLESLDYWDYTYETLPENELVYGFFRQNLADSASAVFYFQLSADAGFSVEEKDGNLSILLRRAPDQEKQKNTVRYYAMTNAYREYCSGVIERNSELSPVLCRNFEDVVLISPPYETQAEAEAFFRNAAESVNLPQEQWEIVALYHNDLPFYPEDMDMETAAAQKVVRVDGTETKLPVLLADGLYLTSAADGTILYSKTIREGDAGIEEEYEELWKLERDGSAHRMLRFEFAAIEQCGYSPDGHKLAVLERAEEGSHLYIFDADTNDLTADLSEMGFGDMIGAFTWNELGNVLYAVSGSAGFQVNQYDFTISDELKRYAAVDKNGADEGSIGVFGGEVYFVQSTLEDGAAVYRIKPEGGVRKTFMEGGAFAFSPDRRYLALSNSSMDTAADGNTAQEFRVVELENGASALVTSAFTVNEFFWSQDGTRLFYFENRLSGGENEGTALGEDTSAAESAESEANNAAGDPYPYALYLYEPETGESRLIGEFSSTAVYPGEESGMLYIPYYDKETMGALVRATYEFRFEEIGQNDGDEQ